MGGYTLFRRASLLLVIISLVRSIMIMISIATKYHFMIMNYVERQSLTLVKNYTHGNSLSSGEPLYSIHCHCGHLVLDSNFWFPVTKIFYQQDLKWIHQPDSEKIMVRRKSNNIVVAYTSLDLSKTLSKEFEVVSTTWFRVNHGWQKKQRHCRSVHVLRFILWQKSFIKRILSRLINLIQSHSWFAEKATTLS